jgi:hypothetical protein
MILALITNKSAVFLALVSAIAINWTVYTIVVYINRKKQKNENNT